MPATPEAAQATAAYRAQLVAARRRALAALAAWWLIDAGDVDGSFLRWLAMADVAVSGTRAVAARLAAGYVATFVAAELDEPPRPVASPLERTRRSARQALLPALAVIHARLDAGAPIGVASDSGRARALVTATGLIDGAADSTLTRAIAADGRVRGWRRVTSASACGACLGSADGDLHAPAEPLVRHPNCRCTKEPVVAEVAERLRRPTGREMFEAKSPAEQNAVFAGRGGEAKADLVRSGAVDLRDLVTVQRTRDQSAPTITETPLARLA